MVAEIFKWNEWDEADLCTIIFYDVEILKDFGPVKKGQKFSSAAVFYNSGTIEFFKDPDSDPTDGASSIRVKIKIVPV